MTADAFAHRRFHELSGGQKQRILICRALATKADILALDEPTAGVDMKATHTLWEFISRIHEERKVTIILVSHDLAVVRRHARHVIWLHEGRVVSGSPDKLLSPKQLEGILQMEFS